MQTSVVMGAVTTLQTCLGGEVVCGEVVVVWLVSVVRELGKLSVNRGAGW